tara:strand:+ start:9414 stop:9992 length:579 start_codon:yes stop_codon:yes gene_type:complete
MASGYGKSKVISVYNGTVNSGAAGVDLVFGDVVMIDPNGSITTEGPTVIDGAAELAARNTFGVVSGKKGIPSGQSGPIIVAGEAYAMVANDGSGDIVAGAFLDVSNTAWGAATTPANGAAAAAVSFEESAQASGAALGAIASETTAVPLQAFLGKTRARMINGTIAATTVGALPAASNTRTLCLVEVFNNPN